MVLFHINTRFRLYKSESKHVFIHKEISAVDESLAFTETVAVELECRAVRWSWVQIWPTITSLIVLSVCDALLVFVAVMSGGVSVSGVAISVLYPLI